MAFLRLLTPHHATYFRLNDPKIEAYNFDTDNSSYCNNLMTKEKRAKIFEV